VLCSAHFTCHRIRAPTHDMPTAHPQQVRRAIGLVDAAWRLQQDHELRTSPRARKAKGQVFTPPGVARFMAKLLKALPREFRVLDPGAGTGCLTAAVCERVLELRSQRRLAVHLFETDAGLLPSLEKTMTLCREELNRFGHSLSYQIHHEDFVLASAVDFGQQRTLFPTYPCVGAFDAVITNPPYFKVNKDCDYTRLMGDVVHGQPNVYAFFLAAAAHCLKPRGQLVAITPRSFCNGLYFRGFRRWFFSQMSLQHVHLFESRTETFREANILQESVITLSRRLGDAARVVRVSRSHGRDYLDPRNGQTLPVDLVLDESCGDIIVRIPETSEDAEILACVEAWPRRFEEVGLRISTGPVVMFRARTFLVREANAREVVPLLSAHNVKPFRIVWPVAKKKWPLAFQDCTASQKHLVPTKNCVLIKRFSAKEERRRLTAACLLASKQAHPRLALENHINYVYHADRDLTDQEVFGIAAIFNSILLDRYFRTISGNTQVNATEIRTMKFPDLDLVRRIGRSTARLSSLTPSAVEAIVLEELGVNSRLSSYLKGLTN
jgi:adenine-specific DNA-methyltransferase